MKKIKRFWHLGKYIEFAVIADIKLEREIGYEYDKTPVRFDGMYEILNNALVAIFSNDAKNYLVLEGRQIELTNEITIKYDIAQKMGALSRLEVYKAGQLIFEIQYENPHEPLMSPPGFPYDEDFFYTNFGYKLAEYIEQVQANSGLVLFPEN